MAWSPAGTQSQMQASCRLLFDLNISIRECMRIVHNYNLRYHRERELCTFCHKLIVVGSCSHGIQDKLIKYVVSIYFAS